MGSEISLTVNEFNLSALPEWYRAERETEKTINKLGSVKELDYYLNNADEYIRRLAILRLQRISLKEATYVLKELLDNAVESNENKYLAAWALKSILSKKDSDLFISNKYLVKFTGNERYEDLFIIQTEDLSPAVRFDFSSSSSYNSIKLDQEAAFLERDIFFETSFDFRQWSSMFRKRFLKQAAFGIETVTALLVSVPLLFIKGVSILFKKISLMLANRKKTKVEKIERTIKPKKTNRKPKIPEVELPDRRDSYSDYSNLRREIYKKPGRMGKQLAWSTTSPGIFTLLKKGGFQMLYFLFSPLRLIRRYKLLIVCFLLAAYLVLAFTEYGRAFTYKYLKFDMRNVPVIAVQKAREYSGAVLSGLNRLTGIEDYKKNDQQGASVNIREVTADVIEKAAEAGRLYSVTAPKGLNIRKSPDPGSEKEGADPLPYGSTVIYLSKSESDDSGRKWYYVEAMDGRSGWVSAKFLKEKKEG
jgi:hypothetical protein